MRSPRLTPLLRHENCRQWCWPPTNQPPSAPKNNDPVAVTFADWQASEKLLATSLNAKLVTKTNSGHNINAYSPQLVIDAIREVVDAMRNGEPKVGP
jgi:hypothetical protein